MITVSIMINTNPVYTRSAVNIGHNKDNPELTDYKLDDGSILHHRREQGAVVLAKMMLDTIKEV